MTDDLVAGPTFKSEIPDSKDLEFVCPTCGHISQDDVVFLCNHCETSELQFKNGVYMCPACFKEGENFQCFRCGSKKVEMKVKGRLA